MPVSSHGSAIGEPLRRLESGHRLHEIVQHLRAAVLFCFPNKTKILVDVSGRAYILRRKWCCYSCIGILAAFCSQWRTGLKEQLSARCRVVTSKVRERILPSQTSW
jgi:hypothetical protein